MLKRRPNLRLTVDTKKDFKVVGEIYKILYQPDSFIPIDQVIDLIDMMPEIPKINNDVIQKQVFGKTD